MPIVSECKKYLNRQGTKNPYVGLIHRLDQPVEGLLIIGKTKDATAQLTKQLSGNNFNKKYYAIVYGDVRKEKDCFTDYIEKTNQFATIKNEKTQNSKKAILSYEKITSFQKDITLLDIEIETGRFHQIRCQLSNHGMPIIGDVKYGTDGSKQIAKQNNIKHVLLYSYYLECFHPKTNQKLEFKINPILPTFQ